MSDSLILFCREWALTSALSVMLAPVYSGRVTVVYNLAQLVSALQERPHTPVMLGLRPHEHVVELYQLQPLLVDRPVLFVARCFYWTDYNLPEWLRLECYGFCTWDTLRDPFSRRMELRRFREQGSDHNNTGDRVQVTDISVNTVLTGALILERVNRWLYRELSATGLTGYEVRVLALMAEGRKGCLPSRARSLHKNNALLKLGMTKHLTDLYRGIKVRPELQAGLPSLPETGVTENSRRLSRGAGR